MTFAEVQKAVQDMNILPSQLYNIEQVKDDRKFSTEFEKLSTLEAENQRLTKEKEELESTSKDAIKKTQLNEARGLLDESMKEGFTDKQREFIKKRFNPDNMEDLSKDAIGKFVENETKAYSEYARLFTDGDDGDDKGKEGGGKPNNQSTEDPVAELMKKTAEA